VPDQQSLYTSVCILVVGLLAWLCDGGVKVLAVAAMGTNSNAYYHVWFVCWMVWFTLSAGGGATFQRYSLRDVRYMCSARMWHHARQLFPPYAWHVRNWLQIVGAVLVRVVVPMWCNPRVHVQTAVVLADGSTSGTCCRLYPSGRLQ
jgi:hypothetical protein